MNPALPSIGLAIPSLNHGQFISKTLESLFLQKNVDLKLAFCDGGSTDQTMSILLPYRDRFAFLRSGLDGGQAAAINEGISQLQNTNYVGWLNSNDLLLPDGLITMATFLEDYPECISVFGKAYIIDEVGNIIGEYPTRPFQKKSFALHCTICQPASLIRRSAWEAVGGLDESIQTCMDYDLWWRLSKIGKIGYLDQFIACSRDHAQSKSRMLRKQLNEEAISILLKHWRMVPRNWCMANILEGLDGDEDISIWKRRFKAIRRYVQINRWKALYPQNWLI